MTQQRPLAELTEPERLALAYITQRDASGTPSRRLWRNRRPQECGDMRGGLKAVCNVVVPLLLFVTPVAAEPSDDAEQQLIQGSRAFSRGHFTTAMRLLRPLADRGQPLAEFDLGLMYEQGHGVQRDLPTAHMWFSLAASNPVLLDKAAANRSRVAAKMSSEQIAEAERLAREWKPK
jgi:TPR repeat protein